MKLNMTCVALSIYAAAYLLLFLMWAGLLVWGNPSVGQEQYLAYIHDALLMLTSHILTILNPSAIPAQPSPTQSLPNPPPMTSVQ